ARDAARGDGRDEVATRRGRPDVRAGRRRRHRRHARGCALSATTAAAAPYMTIAEAAQLIGVAVKTVSRWSREDHTFPALRRGRVVRVHRERYLAWLERQTRQQGARQAQQQAAVA